MIDLNWADNELNFILIILEPLILAIQILIQSVTNPFILNR